MKIRFYCDVWPTYVPIKHTLTATTSPYEKPTNAKRIAFDVVIPDDIVDGVDHYAPDAVLAKDEEQKIEQQEREFHDKQRAFESAVRTSIGNMEKQFIADNNAGTPLTAAQVHDLMLRGSKS